MNSTINNEVWYQDTENHDLWSNDGGLLVNTAALDEREAYFDVTRVDANAGSARWLTPTQLEPLSAEHHNLNS